MHYWPELIDLKTAARVQRARKQPALCFVDVDLPELLKELLAGQFADIDQSVRVSFVSEGPLACIDPGQPAHIYIHQVLNHPDTPREVIRYVLQHELLHLRIPSDGDDAHPPAFRDAEKRLCPDMGKAWGWMLVNLGQFTRKDSSRQQITVGRNWRDIWRREGRPLAFEWGDLDSGRHCRSVDADPRVPAA
ncbi:MAG: DUF45 domain-containing protein [Planctomycetota bacterium]|nr:DUF45 domain-containing protein [Planctomycetota bacterium]MDA1251855.1 DUF45 domain-containing protein [Planctomycetota bacterium]